MRGVKLSSALFVVARGINTLKGTHAITALDSRPECSIEQCLNAEIYSPACAAAAATNCSYTNGLVVSGSLTDADICAFPGPPTETSPRMETETPPRETETPPTDTETPPRETESPLTETLPTETPLWMKLDLNVADISELGPWFSGYCSHISGTMAFETLNPRSGAGLSLYGFGSPSLECEDPVVDSEVGEVATWATSSNRVEFLSHANLFEHWNATLFDGNHSLILNAPRGFTETAVGGITGFVAEDWWISCAAYSVGTLLPVSPFRDGAVSLSNVTGSCLTGCGEIEGVAAAEECIAAAEPDCDFSATYTLSNSNVRAEFCQVDDNTRVSEEWIFPRNLWRNANTRGSVFLDIGSAPYKTCQVEVSLLTSLPWWEPECGLPNAHIASKETFTIGPDTRSMELTQLPDNFVGVAVTADKDWRFCGGSVNAFRVTEGLTSTLYITPPTPSDTPSDTKSSDNGGSAALLLAAVSFASLMFVL